MNLKKLELGIAKLLLRSESEARQKYIIARRFWVAHTPLRLSVLFAVLFGIFWIGGWGRLDSDFGWHLQSGYYIRAHGIPAHDIYTFTASNFRWIDHEWGNDVILSFVYGWGGYWLADCMYAAVWAGALLIAAGRKARLLTLLIAALAVTPYGFVRPLAWTVLFLSATIALLRSKKVKWYWGLPLLFVLWANMHAGFVAGLAVIGYFAVQRRSKQLALIVLLCFAATFINAYGPRLYEEIFRTISDPQIHYRINEWAYLKVPRPAQLFVILWAAGFLMFSAKKWKQWLGLSPILMAATLSATRNLPLFVVGSLREIDEYVEKVLKQMPKKLDAPRKIVLGTMLGVLFVLFVSGFKEGFLPYNTNRDAGLPVQAVAYLKVHPCSGNMFNSYNYGGYLIWKLPSQKVYIDGRMPTWEPYMDRYEALIQDPDKNYPIQFQQYHITCALIQQGSSKLIQALEDAYWGPVVSGNGSVLLVAPSGTK